MRLVRDRLEVSSGWSSDKLAFVNSHGRVFALSSFLMITGVAFLEMGMDWCARVRMSYTVRRSNNEVTCIYPSDYDSTLWYRVLFGTYSLLN